MTTKKDIEHALATHRRKEHSMNEFKDFRKAAVLVPLYPTSDGLGVLLTIRTQNVETHKGQISFPGGARDSIDKNPIDTALRETKEELGIDLAAIEVLGLLDDHPVPSKFIITPVVGFLSTEPRLTPHNAEVAEVFTAPLSFFAEAKNGFTEEREFQHRKVKVWHFQFERYHIWGATAAIIKNLIDLLHKT